jgi:hypothetical protein
MLRFASWTKTYDQDLEKMQEMKIELHYQFFITKIPVTIHKQHSKFQFEFSLGMVAKW